MLFGRKRTLLGIAVALAGTLPALSDTSRLPVMALTRFLSTGGIERMLLVCQASPDTGDASRKSECEIWLEKNGQRVNRATVTIPKAKKLLATYFSSIPKEKVSRNVVGDLVSAAEESGEPSTLLAWAVSDGYRVTRGSMPRYSIDYGAEVRAVLALEVAFEAILLR